MIEFDYEKDIQIDHNALEIEWLGQASLMLKYGRAAAQAKMEGDLSKERLEVIKAQLDRDIRAKPETFGITKITESAVTATITTHSDYQAATQEFIAAQYELTMAQAAVRAVDARRSALENLVRLHGQQYFAGPSVPRDLDKEWEQRERQKRADKSVTMTRGKKRKKE